MISGLPWGLAVSSGVNTYLPLFLLALFARYSHLVHLSPRFEFLVSDQAVLVLGLLAACEILAQKFPVLDNLWDFAHTLLRPIAGALAAGATLNTDRAFEIVVAMLTGGTLAAAAHSAKSSIRLMSTSKSFGTANFILSLGEDAAVVTGTLLSVYAPWVMLGVVLLFVLIFALIGPRLARTLLFNLHMVAGSFAWLWGRFFPAPVPARLQESLLELAPDLLQTLSAQLESGEQVLGVLTGWKRSPRGPWRSWLLVTSRRLLLVERRLFRIPKVQPIAYSDLLVARYRSVGLFSKIDLLTRHNETFTSAKPTGLLAPWLLKKSVNSRAYPVELTAGLLRWIHGSPPFPADFVAKMSSAGTDPLGSAPKRPPPGLLLLFRNPVNFLADKFLDESSPLEDAFGILNHVGVPTKVSSRVRRLESKRVLILAKYIFDASDLASPA